MPTAPRSHPLAPRPKDAQARFLLLPRRLADLGALATTIAVVWSVTMDVRWAVLLIVALGFAGAAVTRGWAGAQTGVPSGIPQTRAAGVLLAAAPRRLLAWPALAAGTLALWSWLDRSGSSYEIEAFALPPAVSLIVFAAALVWLRRRAEATIAVIAGFTLALVLPAIVAVVAPWLPLGLAAEPDSPVRGTVVAIVAGVLAVALAWTPLRRVGMPALAGAVVALVALAIVAVEGAVTPEETGWLLLLVGSAYASAFGFVRSSPFRPAPVALPTGLPAPTGEVRFASIVPPIVLALASLAAGPSLDEPLVVAVALAILGSLHLTAAALQRTPLASATRWTAFAGAAVVATQALLIGDIDAVESVTIPLAAVLLGGAALAMWRRARAGLSWPGGERIAWLAGLALAVAPTVIAAPNDPRTWLLIAGALLAAIGCVVAPIADSTALKTPSAVLLAAGALAMGVRALLDPAVVSGDFAAAAAGLGALVVSAAMVWMSDDDTAPLASTGLAAAGAALVVAVVFVQSDGELVQTSLTAMLAGAVGVGGAAMLRWRRWAGVGAVLAVAGVLAALLAAGTRFARLAASGDAGIEPDLWVLVGVGILIATGVMALRSTPSAAVADVVRVVFTVALVIFAAAELLLLGGEGDDWRTVLTMSALTAAGVIGWLWRARLGVSFAPTAAVLAGLFGILALTLFAVRPFELVTVPPALGMIFIGARALRKTSALRTWPTLGPGLALLTVPSLLYDFGTTTLWRVVALGVIGIGLVVIGAVWRLQAPLILGSAVVLVHAVNQLWPWIETVYGVVPWWLWLGIGGALLIYLAARYERQVRALRTAFTAVTSLR